MNYTVRAEANNIVSVEYRDGEVLLAAGEPGDTVVVSFTDDQFQQLIKAVGYVWTDLAGQA
jgi:hypothetical protein